MNSVTLHLIKTFLKVFIGELWQMINPPFIILPKPLYIMLKSINV